jgi:hypothetical protein
MLTNSTILRIDTPAAPTPAGSVTWTAGAAMSCRAATRDYSGKDKYQGNAGQQAVADAKLEVLVRDLNAALALADYDPTFELAAEQRIVVLSDSGVAAGTYRVRNADVHAKNGMSFWALTLVRD